MSGKEAIRQRNMLSFGWTIPRDRHQSSQFFLIQPPICQSIQWSICFCLNQIANWIEFQISRPFETDQTDLMNDLRGLTRSSLEAHKKLTVSHQKLTRSLPGAHQELTRSLPGAHQISPGTHRGLTRNSPGAHQKLSDFKNFLWESSMKKRLIKGAHQWAHQWATRSNREQPKWKTNNSW